ncbi:external alternative NAD(P)H-ubiquinone oxidoreductase B2, mitochondrial-like [Juglans microcarpa x Juglans regia]|uniref:external alternative NAD(P)H-ubiquinone oxidoreductase B2, mitochondrial-like n=1 Tax=Juglans microcarpa x Juglans regia TaxID=2249226 RepID=UPI001B7DE22D|nr:external alternative NAD(P)H-ubiquinone oxidoreductase B2, mitochondrial-like [Juglans microcarpa x Juglans regia]
MVVWATGNGTRPEIMAFMKQIGQANRHAFATDEWLGVGGCENVYALGDCATVNQCQVMEDIAFIFNKADKNKSGTLNLKDFQEIVDDILERYPQVKLHLKRRKVGNFSALLKNSQENAQNQAAIEIEKFKSALSEVDSQIINLPATAQVAGQQGEYLADCFNRMEECEKYPEGPLRFRGSERHRFHPFRYNHLGKFAPLGGKQVAIQCPGDWVWIGHGTRWIWYSVYTSKLASWRARILVISDWGKRFIFGRDLSRIRD